MLTHTSNHGRTSCELLALVAKKTKANKNGSKFDIDTKFILQFSRDCGNLVSQVELILEAYLKPDQTIKTTFWPFFHYLIKQIGICM